MSDYYSEDTTPVDQPQRLGAEVTPEGTHFRLWAPKASAVDLTLIDRNGSLRQRDVSMTRGSKGVWSVFVNGIGHGQLYGFRVDGPWQPHQGLRFNRNLLLVDPYARAVFGGVDYDGPIYDHVPGDRWQMSTTDSIDSVPLSVVVEDTPPPTPIARRRPMSESVVYETHLKGFTRRHPRVPQHMRGTYAGMGHPAVVQYLVDLGVTAVEFLPLHSFLPERFVWEKGLTNYWGYSTLGFFAPHADYGSRGEIGEEVLAFKNMVSALHEAGIEVILDVVYNHTCEGGSDGPTLSMRGIDPGYYRLTHHGTEDYDVTGCGNSLNTDHRTVRRLVLDSLRYWVTEMGVDGFRFDLATTLIRDGQHHVTHHHAFKEELKADPVFDDIKIIVEPWDIGPFGYQVGGWGPGWAEWNDKFRDFIREYWRGATHGVQELATRLAGSPDLFDREGRGPQDCVNFITAHDGFTMRDLVSYEVKYNRPNGENNRDGTDNNRSSNHGAEGETDDPQINALRRRQVLNMMATQVLAVGTPMITAGDERGRTQHGNNNAYCQDSEISWMDWSASDEWATLHPRVRDLLRLRSRHPVLRSPEFAHHNEILSRRGENLHRVDLTWIDASGSEMSTPAWHDGSRRLLGMYQSDENEAFLAWFNSSEHAVTVTLPGMPWAYGYHLAWTSADDHEYPSKDFPPHEKLVIPGRTVTLLHCLVPRDHHELLDLMQMERETGS
ncbi:glycogen debranching protein GlgX [Tessaracoccus caeni]|uniref:glycogen debranching protein GlgX n=1 Tax=Tessaracoccus caeni TaxID=3031239 RepID=UPI0023DC8D4D|nr:glycogen debranching protein GlgX [Tessaracoccus caeni]